MYERIIQTFHQSIETKMQAGELLAPLIAKASELVVGSLLNEGKVLVAGNGCSTAIGQVFVTTLINRLKQERPSLPAVNIASDSAVLTAVANDFSFNDVFAKQIRALGNAGDVLLMISSSGNSSNLVQAVAAAHDRQVNVVALTGGDGGDLATLLDANDLELRVPSDSAAHVHEVHLLTTFCLCDLIDFQLFGAEEPL
ncbi:SIS domain-containing protein [Gilvimarinus sp. F26214L]|uniref:SIS domain-containing protein n=1 Tax=Gilvimarinus sp. DZF01 TaxID=3461371 RepID=UPI00404679B6